MSETQFSDDPLSINEDEFLPLFQKQLVFTGFNESLLSTVRNFNLFDAREMYRSLNNKNVPISAIWGTLDGVVPYSGSEEFKQIFPNGRLITIEEGTHDITYRQPTQVGRAIIDFIDSHQD
jgi:pimeloyl-ACP methyl ester carboxylesterase